MAGTLSPPPSSLVPVGTGGSWLTRLRNGISPDAPYDGAFVGEVGGKPAAFGASSDPDAVPPIEPDAGSYGASHPEGTGDIIFVNGIDTPWKSAYGDAKALANQTGQPVINVHESTSAIGNAGWTGTLGDALDTLANYGGLAEGQAPKTLATTILDKLDRNEPVHIVAHSKGALVTSEALSDVTKSLEARGDTPAQARKALSGVEVETFGGASSSFPDGPQYVHYVNKDDLVPDLFGLGHSGGHPGAGATTLFFDDNRFGFHDLDPTANHHFDTAYLTDERVPFDLARTLGPNTPGAIVSYVDTIAHRPGAQPRPLVSGP